MIINLLNSLASELSFGIDKDNLTIRADQIRARLSLYPEMMALQVIAEFLFVLLFWNQADHQTLLVWLATLYAIHAIDMLLWFRFREPLNTVSLCKRWKLYFNVSTTVTALALGSIALLFFSPDFAYQILMICFILGLAAGAMTMDPVYPPSLFLYILGITLPMLGRLIFEGTETHIILAGMMSLFVVGSLSAGQKLSKTFWESLQQRYENNSLIEQLTQQKAIAETANRNKSHFLASASHDLRQPLQALVLFSDALQNTEQGKDSQDLANKINSSVSALVDMFDELLDLSKLDAGVMLPKQQDFELQSIFNKLESDFLPVATAKGLLLNIQATSLCGFSDPQLIERILRNLVSNAIRYTDVGSILITSEKSDNFILLKIRDTGIGISESNLPHIFDEYYQVGNQHRDRLKGLGLGLAIVRRISTLLKLDIHVSSTPAIGSTFHISIPSGKNPAPPPTQESPLKSKHNLSGKIIALIEDNQDIRKMATQLMKQWGCDVHEGELPEEVLGKMAASNIKPDILICDYRLPQNLTARDAIKLLQELWQTDIPVIVLTGDTSTHHIQDILASGALLLHKPIAPARLRTMVYFALQEQNELAANLKMP